MEALIKSGSMDDLGERGQLLFNLENMWNTIKKMENKQKIKILFLEEFNNFYAAFKLKEVQPATSAEKLFGKKNYLVYIFPDIRSID